MSNYYDESYPPSIYEPPEEPEIPAPPPEEPEPEPEGFMAVEMNDSELPDDLEETE